MYMDTVVIAGILAVAGTVLVAVGVAIAIWMDSEDPEVERRQHGKDDKNHQQ